MAVDWSQFKPVAPQAPAQPEAQQVDWSQFKPVGAQETSAEMQRTWGEAATDTLSGVGGQSLGMISGTTRALNQRQGGSPAFEEETGTGPVGGFLYDMAGTLAETGFGVQRQLGRVLGDSDMEQSAAKELEKFSGRRAALEPGQRLRSEFAEDFARQADEYASRVPEVQSAKAKQISKEMSALSNIEGFGDQAGATIDYFASPFLRGDFASGGARVSKIMESLIPSLAGGGIAARATGALRLGSDAQKLSQFGTMTLMEAGGAAEGARQQVLELGFDVLQEAPEFQAALRMTGGNPERALMLLADQAASIAFGAGTLTSAATMGMGEVFGANVAEKALREGVGSLAAAGGLKSAAKSVAGSTAKEFGSEFAQGSSNQLSQNLGTVSVGAESNLGRGVVSAGIMEGIAGAGSGLATQTMGEVTKRLRPVQDGEDLLGGSNVQTGDPGAGSPGGLNIPDDPSAEPITAAEIQTLRDQQLSALVSKRDGRPDQEVIDPATGRPVVVRGEASQPLADAERQMLDFLQKYGERPDVLARALGRRLDDNATSGVQAPQQATPEPAQPMQQVAPPAAVQPRGIVSAALNPAPDDDMLVNAALAELALVDDESPLVAGAAATNPQPGVLQNVEEIAQEIPGRQAGSESRPGSEEAGGLQAEAGGSSSGLTVAGEAGAGRPFGAGQPDGSAPAQPRPADAGAVEQESSPRQADASGELGADSVEGQPLPERSIQPPAIEPRSSESFIPQIISEFGWSQIGGLLIRDPNTAIDPDERANPDGTKGDVKDRTKWIGKPDAFGGESNFWRLRPGAGKPGAALSKKEATGAIDAWRKGRKLGARQQEFIDYMKLAAAEYAERWQQDSETQAREFVELEEQGIAEEQNELRALSEPIPDSDAREALTLQELLRKAIDAGATRDQLAAIIERNPDRRDHAREIWHVINQRSPEDAPDQQASAGASGPDGETEGAGQAEPVTASPRSERAEESPSKAAESAQGLTLSQQSAPPVSQQAAPPRQQGGLFAPPTRGEVIDGERKKRDDARDGKNATGRTDMMAGDGELFAGPRPEQIDVEQAIAAEQPRQPSSNTIFTEDAAEKARARLRAKLGRPNSGIDPEMLQDGITLAGYHIERGARTFSAYAQAMIEDMGDAVRPFLKSWYLGVKFDPRASSIAPEMDSAAAVESADANQEFGDVPSNPDSLAGDRQPQEAATSAVAVPDVDDRSGNAGRAGGAAAALGDAASASDSARGDSGRAPADGALGDQRVPERQPDGRGFAAGDAGASDSRGSGADGGLGISPDRDGARGATEAAARARGDVDKLAAQRAAESVPIKVGDRANIDATLPYLLDGQREDVAKAEARFAKPDGYGMLFTNGTGTGKTFTGLGVVKRFERQGKKNILIVAPSDKIMSDWIKSGVPLGLEIIALENTADAGRGIVVTTYANLGQNDALAKREWDLVVADEAHYLTRNADGDETGALKALRAITMHPDGVFQRTDMLHRDLVERGAKLRAEADAASRSTVPEVRAQGKILSERAQAVFRELDEKRKAIEAEVLARQGEARPRAVFLSATPFAYEKTVRWAQGYLFNYPDVGEGRGYNSPDAFGAFMASNFGYRMRYGKLTAPEAGVDSGLMQRMFNTRLKREGVLSGRRLDVAADYSRTFSLIESAIGRRIDQALEWLRENDKSGDLSNKLREQFDYLARRYTLEALKARESVALIREHLALGRKVVVFHDYKKGGARNPFIFDPLSKGGESASIIAAFESEFGDLIEGMSGLFSPIDLLQNQFPDLLLFNGSVSPKNRRANVDTFNNDATGPRVILVQTDAGKEGISLHDTTGEHQRALINLGMPTKPTDLIQQEGRIYRTGQVSNAIFSYLNTGTSWERWTFAQTIAGRASAAENLGMGEEARALKDSLVQAFEDSASLRPGHDGEGTGGKAADASAARALTEHDRAVALYYANQKKTAKTKSAEGTDYFATPEPVGLAMVRLADIRPGESALEPSAGHGAIARWFGETVKKTAVEPSAELSGRLALSFDGRIVDGRFESLDLVNKFDAIVMNPPFGTAGRTAVDHVAKAAKHLREGGRVVALIPAGPSADKKFDAWLYELDDKGRSVHPDLHLVATVELPAVTFERAGTSVRTRIVVIDKMADGNPPQQAARDLSSAETIKELFERVENLEIRTRAKAAEAEPAPAAKPADERKATAAARAEAFESAKQAGAAVTGEPVVTHITGKGKELVGVVRMGLTPEQARSIDPYTFRKNGGWFLRADRLAGEGAKSVQVREDGATYGKTTDVQAEPERAGVAARKAPAYNGEGAPAPVQNGQLDLFLPEPSVERERARFANRAVPVQIGAFRSGVRVVNGPEDAAHIIAPLRKSPQEKMVALVLDAERKPLAVIQHSIGEVDGASVEPWSLLGAIAQVEGARAVYFAHNHPSGKTQHSRADQQITSKLRDIMRGSGIRSMGMLTVAPNSREAGFQDDGEGSIDLPVTAAARREAVPILERAMRKTLRGAGRIVTDPIAAKAIVSEAKPASGVLLLDTRHRVVGTVEIDPAADLALRSGDPGAGVMRLLSMFAEANAPAAITFGSEGAALNVGAMLSQAGIRVLDRFYKTPGSDAWSSAEESTGKDVVSPRGFFSHPRSNFSQPQPGDRIPMGPLRSEAAIRFAVAAALDGWRGQKPIVRVVKTSADLPADAKAGEGWQTAEGYFDGDQTVWMVTENLTDPQRALEVLRHEAVGHFGVERIAATEWPAILAGVEAMRSQKRIGLSRQMAAALADVESRYPDAAESDPTLFAKELIAVMAESDTRASFMDRMVAAVRRFLRRTGLIGEAFSEAEIRRVLSGAFRLVERGDITAGAPVAAAGMASMRPDDVAAYILRTMAQNDADLFRYPKSDSKRFTDVVRQVTNAEVSAVRLGETNANFTESSLDVLPAIKWGLRTVDGATVFVYIEKPGIYTPASGPRVYIDASQANAGASKGSAIYAALFQWALNTGHTFIGDPNGLSTEALLRRTEHMLSAALKHGTTRMMAPHARQLDPRNIKHGPSQTWASAMSWTDGDDVGNITSLIRTSVENLRGLMEGTDGEGAVYRVSDGVFVGAGGEALTDDGLRRIAAQAGERFRRSGRFVAGESRAAAIGGATIARALVLKAIADGSAGSQGERRELLAQLAKRLASQRLTYDAARGQFYSRPGPDQLAPTEAPTFYSAAARAIERAQGAPKRADAAAWKQWLDGAVRRGDMKQSERDWLDIDGWLDRQEAPITREALAGFVRSNEVQVQEVVLSEGNSTGAEPDILGDYTEPTGDDIPKFANYRTPGGENYRELLLTLPAKTGAPLDLAWRQNDDGKWAWFSNGLQVSGGFPSEDYRESARPSISTTAAPPGVYRSSHWDQPNVLAHIRFDERTDAEGKRVLFVQEIQSDWHQDGRKNGYGEREETVPRRTRMSVRRVPEAQRYTDRAGRTFEWGVYDGNELVSGSFPTEIDALNESDKLDPPTETRKVDGIPNAPLKQTDEWAMLAFKRAARWAVDNGFDRIAWATGEQNADLFDLSKSVRRVEYTSDGRLLAEDTNRVTVINERVAEEKLSDYIGKEAAEKLLSQEPRWHSGLSSTTARSRVLEGQQLKVGGEGMRGFYDKILPAAVGKWAKKFGGKVGSTEFVGVEGPDDVTRLHAIDITQAMRDAVRSGQPMFSRPAQQTARAAVLAARQRAQQLTSRETIDRLIYEVQDQFIDLKRIQAHIRESGGTVSDLTDAYLGEELYHSRVMARHERFMESELKPLLADLNSAGFTTEQFEQFLHARHAPEANAVLAERNPDQAKVDAERSRTDQAVKALRLQLQRAGTTGTATRAIEQALAPAEEEAAHWKRVQPFKGTAAERAMLSGMSDADAAAAIAALDPADRAKMGALAARVDAINAKTLDQLQRYGLMSREALDAWRQTYQFYVPLHRDEANPDSVSHPTGSGYSVRGDAAKARTGSAKAKVTHILAHIAMQREAAITRGEKNNVAKKLYGLAAQNPDPNLWTLDKPPTITRVDEATGTVRTMPDPTYRQRPNVVMVRIAGEDRAIVFNERNPQALRLAESLKNLHVEDLHKLLGTVGKGTRWLASVNTQYNPVFGVVNLIRDVQGGALQLSTTPLKGKELKVASRIPAMIRSIYRERRGKGTSSPEDARIQRLWDDMRMTGGVTGYRDLFRDPMERANAIEAELKKADRGGVSRAAHAVVDWLSDYNEAIENATRLAVYEQALAQGLTKERAASLAKNITVNFNRKGRQTRELGALYAFFNAAVQGTTRMIETLNGPRGRAIMAGGVLVGFVNTLIGLAVMGGDEWEKIPGFVKERAVIIPISGKDYITIPMPLGYNVFPNIGRIASEMMTGNNETAAGSVGELLRIGADSFNPLGGGDLSQMATPTVLDPVVSLWRNQDWTGKPIYREDFSSLNPTPGFTRAKGSASMPARVIAWSANALSGGDDYEPGAFSPTPDQIDYVLGQLTGGLGREILKAQTTLAAPFTDDELPAYKIPLVSRLYGNTRGQSGESERFYAAVRELNIVENRMKGMARAGEDVDAYIASEPLTELVFMGTRSQSVVQRLRRAQREATEAGDSEQAKVIGDQITEIMADLNREVREAKR